MLANVVARVKTSVRDLFSETRAPKLGKKKLKNVTHSSAPKLLISNESEAPVKEVLEFVAVSTTPESQITQTEPFKDNESEKQIDYPYRFCDIYALGYENFKKFTRGNAEFKKKIDFLKQDSKFYCFKYKTRYFSQEAMNEIKEFLPTVFTPLSEEEKQSCEWVTFWSIKSECSKRYRFFKPTLKDLEKLAGKTLMRIKRGRKEFHRDIFALFDTEDSNFPFKYRYFDICALGSESHIDFRRTNPEFKEKLNSLKANKKLTCRKNNVWFFSEEAMKDITEFIEKTFTEPASFKMRGSEWKSLDRIKSIYYHQISCPLDGFKGFRKKLNEADPKLIRLEKKKKEYHQDVLNLFKKDVECNEK